MYTPQKKEEIAAKYEKDNMYTFEPDEEFTKQEVLQIIENRQFDQTMLGSNGHLTNRLSIADSIPRLLRVLESKKHTKPSELTKTAAAIKEASEDADPKAN